MNPLMTFLDTIRDHLDLYDLPPVAAVDVTTGYKPVTVMLEAFDLPAVASGLLAWADTLDQVTASLWRVSDRPSVHLSITGRMASGVPVRVWSAVAFSEAIFPDLPSGSRQEMPVFVLRVWADLGEVAA
ncbi:hypothetical protein [Amycolatopsis sp.]|jgi:hypothetical protein|uniref:hypothetical protein n=1 Tax=Amycolatopsis sp. TaxID=37632 RepID=UPI002DFDDAB4|nr:hypothetical protein [Amycolatopsis sp.]